jgi:hypothetical protein
VFWVKVEILVKAFFINMEIASVADETNEE